MCADVDVCMLVCVCVGVCVCVVRYVLISLHYNSTGICGFELSVYVNPKEFIEDVDLFQPSEHPVFVEPVGSLIGGVDEA